jgi:hypothetical protein
VDGGRHGVDESLVGVGAEVDGDGGCVGQRADHLDVEHDLAVGAVRLARGVAAPVDRYGRHGGRGQVERREERLEIGGPVAAAELDDPDALPGPSARRELVRRRHLRRRVRQRGRRSHPVLRAGLTPAVETKDPGHHVGHSGRKGERPLAPEVGPPGVRPVDVELGPERRHHGVDTTREPDQPPGGVGLDDVEPVIGRE